MYIGKCYANVTVVLLWCLERYPGLPQADWLGGDLWSSVLNDWEKLREEDDKISAQIRREHFKLAEEQGKIPNPFPAPNTLQNSFIFLWDVGNELQDK